MVELKGQDGLTGIVLDREHHGSTSLEVAGIFIEIGADPRVELAKQLGLELNEITEIKVDQAGRTGVDGIFAAGDVTDGSGDLKQTITAAAQGARAATSAYEYVSEHAYKCQIHAMGYVLA